jgi:hypothetical protein
MIPLLGGVFMKQSLKLLPVFLLLLALPFAYAVVGPTASVTIKSPYPQGNNYVFICNTLGPWGSPISYDWDFGDGSKLYDRSVSDVYHTFSAAGTYPVTCVANDGTNNAPAWLVIHVGPVDVPEFGGVAAGIVVLFGIGLIIFRRRK